MTPNRAPEGATSVLYWVPIEDTWPAEISYQHGAVTKLPPGPEGAWVLVSERDFDIQIARRQQNAQARERARAEDAQVAAADFAALTPRERAHSKLASLGLDPDEIGAL